MTLRSPRAAFGLLAATALALALVPATPAIAAKRKPKPTVKAVKNAKLGKKIVVDSRGRTLYRLDPETTTSLLCTSATCLGAWPLASVKSAKTKLVLGTGIQGTLRRLKRGTSYQLTLRGQPLYLFVGDTAAGQANGDGLVSFGGTWRVIPARTSTTTAAPPSSPIPAY